MQWLNQLYVKKQHFYKCRVYFLLCLQSHFRETNLHTASVEMQLNHYVLYSFSLECLPFSTSVTADETGMGPWFKDSQPLLELESLMWPDLKGRMELKGFSSMEVN